MAGPITHTVLAEKASGDFLQVVDRQQFIVGNLFPDIRYLGVVDRKDTHHQNVTLSDVAAETDAFRAGVLFHSLIDEVREDLVRQRGGYANLPDSHLSTIALKVREDIMLHDRSKSWEVYVEYLRDIQSGEKSYGISSEKLAQWHSINSRLLSNPSVDEYMKFLSLAGFNKSQTDEVARLVREVEAQALVEGYIDTLYVGLQATLES